MEEYRRKTLYVGAIQLTESNAAEVAMRADGRGRIVTEIDPFDDNKKVETVNVMFMEGGARMKIGDWLVKHGEEIRIFSDGDFQEMFEHPDA